MKQGGHNNLQMLVTSREDYIATAEAGKSFPWRIVMVVDNDIDLAVNDMVWKLATPDDGSDYSWVRPGKVAWDWWNDWNLYGVDFKTGVNNDTYKYYIDFAAARRVYIEVYFLFRIFTLKENKLSHIQSASKESYWTLPFPKTPYGKKY